MTPIQFGHIEIAGDTYPVKFGTAQARDYCQLLNCEIKDFNALFDVDKQGKNKFLRLETNGEEMIALVFSALKQGARVEKKDFDLSLDDVADLIDYMNRETTSWEAFFKILTDGVVMEANPKQKPEATVRKLA